MRPGAVPRVAFPTTEAALDRAAHNRGQLGALAEKELFHLFQNQLLAFESPRVEPILVDYHLEMLGPHLPGLLGNVLENPLPHLAIEGASSRPGNSLPNFTHWTNRSAIFHLLPLLFYGKACRRLHPAVDAAARGAYRAPYFGPREEARPGTINRVSPRQPFQK